MDKLNMDESRRPRHVFNVLTMTWPPKSHFSLVNCHDTASFTPPWCLNQDLLEQWRRSPQRLSWILSQLAKAQRISRCQQLLQLVRRHLEVSQLWARCLSKYVACCVPGLLACMQSCCLLWLTCMAPREMQKNIESTSL